jgi:hypothetical protein
VSHYRNRPVARGRRSGSAASFARKASAVFAIWSENAFLEIIRNRCDTKTCTPPLPINTYLSTPIYQHLSINTYLSTPISPTAVAGTWALRWTGSACISSWMNPSTSPRTSSSRATRSLSAGMSSTNTWAPARSPAALPCCNSAGTLTHSMPRPLSHLRDGLRADRRLCKALRPRHRLQQPAVAPVRRAPPRAPLLALRPSARPSALRPTASLLGPASVAAAAAPFRGPAPVRSRT